MKLDTRIKSGIRSAVLVGIAILMISLFNGLIGFENTVLAVCALYLWRSFQE